MLSEELLADGGVYMLQLHLEQAAIITVGVLGDVHFTAGDYLYVGSAFGPGGVKARLGRHLRGDGKLHWHIDTLRSAAKPVGGCYHIPHVSEIDQPIGEKLPLKSYECRWSQTLATLPELSAPVPGFGSSDCHSGCISHLLIFDPAQRPSGIDRSMPRLTETLARSINIEESDLHCIQLLSAREIHS